MSNDEFQLYLKEEIKDIKRTQIIVLQTIAKLEVKSSVWGFVSGTIPAIGTILFMLIRGA